MKALTISLVTLLAFTGCTNTNGQVFGDKADKGALLGGLAGAVIGAHNGNALKGALIGTGAGLAAGAIADANDARQQPTPVPPPPPIPAQGTAEVVVKEAPVVVVETPVIIDERIWVGNDLWIYSYHGYRNSQGHVRYQTHVPFHRRFIRGGIGFHR